MTINKKQSMPTFIARTGSRFVSHIPHCCVNFLSRFSVTKVIISDNGSLMSVSDHSPSTSLIRGQVGMKVELGGYAL